MLVRWLHDTGLREAAAAHARALSIHDPYLEELVVRVSALRDGNWTIPAIDGIEAVGQA